MLRNTDTALQNNDRLSDLETVFQQLVLLDRAVSEADIHDSLNKLLEAVGKYTRADRAYIFIDLNSDKIFSNAYEWCGEGVIPQIDNLQQIHSYDMPVWYDIFSKGKNIIIENIEDIKEIMPDEYEMLKAQDIRTEISFPIYHSSKLLGFIGVDNPEISESQSLISILEVIGGHLGSSWSLFNANKSLREKDDRLGENERALEKEKNVLERLCMDYTSVYYLDLYTDEFEVMKLRDGSNASDLLQDENITTFSELLEKYAQRYISEESVDEFRHWLSNSHLKELLSSRERGIYRYTSRPNIRGQKYFEVQAIRVKQNEQEFGIILGFRYIDDIVLQEQERQAELEKALAESRLNNEIVSAISKIYFSIYRIDLPNDYCEEISGNTEIHRLTGKTGRAAARMTELCNTFVADEYHDTVMKFFDLSTLPERLSTDDTVAAEYLAKDGNWHLARFIAKKRDFSGKVTHVLYVTALISAEKRREQNLIILAEDARRANEAKTEFLSRMAHDIRTPMNAVGGFTSIAMANVNDPEKVKKNLEQVEIACGYLQQIVNDALDLAEIGKGKAKVHNEETSISDVFADYEETIRGAMPEKHLNIVCRKHDIIHDCVLTDPLRLRQIYMNLLSNALKFTPGGGTVEFEIYEEELPEKGRVRLVSIIKDNGIGMTPQYMRVMYDRFSRAVDTRLNKVRGSGLGLSIVKELIDLMGGHIEASSALGKGTTFKVTFELDYTDRKHEHKHECRIDGKYDECIGMRILVAEDNDLNYEIAEELLKLHGVICDHAENGQVCVNIFRESAPFYYSAILMDLQMPVMDGLRAARLIRSTDSDYARKIPIIALSANSFSEDVKASLDAGMDEHLSKPFDADKLLELLMLHKNK